MLRNFMLILALLGLILGFTACGETQPSGDGGGNSGANSTGPIKIGFGGPLSGDSSAFGIQAQMGAQLFVDELNAAGGIDGRNVELVVKDDEGKTDTAGFVARELVSDPAIVAMTGHLNSRCTLATAAIANKAHLPQITYGSTATTICKGNPYTFRNIYTDDSAGAQLADFCKNELKVKRVSCYYENDAYGQGLFSEFKKQSEKIGLELVYSKPYDTNMNPDYQSALQSFMGANPEVLFISSAGNSTSTVCKIAKELNPNLQVLSGDGSFQESFIKGALDKAEGAIVSGPADFSTSAAPEVKAFLEAFKKKYNEEPSVWAFQAYDAVGLLVHAIQSAGADREKIAEFMRGMTTPEKAYNGVTGPTYFDENGDPVGKPVNFFQVRDQKFVPYK